ncbi:MAG: heparinase II/III family protein, partial [Hymenobacter sp.]|nr:heparinase II/III family protein [Hymenobacter sp.]
MRPTFLLFCAWLALCGAPARAQRIDIPAKLPADHPRIYADASGQAVLKAKLARAPWAAANVARLQRRLEPYLQRVAKDSTWLLSRLQMYWRSHHTNVYIRADTFVRADGQAPVPTVRYAGSRDWASRYDAPKLEELLPYDDRPDGTVNMRQAGQSVWVAPEKTGLNIERTNQRIMELAQDAAFLYWYTGERKYAKLAAGVFTTYVTGLGYRNLPTSLDGEKGNFISGLTSFEVIHEGVIPPTVLCYDFLHDYLQRTRPGFAAETVAPVFQKWADNHVAHGIPDNNWNIFEARHLAYLAMGLGDNAAYKNGHGAQHYLDIIYNQNLPRQRALTECLKGFDPATGMWWESPGYSVNVSADFLQILLLTDRVMTGRLQALLPGLEKAVFATAQYLMPNKMALAFGDGHYHALPAHAAEHLISWHRKYADPAAETRCTQFLQYTQGADHEREGNDLFELFFNVDQLKSAPPATAQDFQTPTFYAPNVSWLVQRSNYADPRRGLLLSANASLGNHSHANGLSVELYGKGYPLGPDFAAGDSYWHPNHRDFYAGFAAHNTVVVDGKSTYAHMRGTHPFELLGVYPKPEQRAGFFPAATFTNLTFTEPATQAEQRRLLGIVRTSDSTGYYVDIFRSRKSAGGDVKNEFLYHNIGQKSWVEDAAGQTLSFQPTDELSSAKGDIVGYNYFTDKTTATYSGDFTARFELTTGTSAPVWMSLWMAGAPGRQLFAVKSPKSRALNAEVVPADVAAAPVPTLVVRQPGEAWTRPFVAVYEPSYARRGAIANISSFAPAAPNPEFVGVKISGNKQATQYVFSDVAGRQPNMYQQYAFTGTYAVASEQGTELQYLFLGSGQALSCGDYALTAKAGPLTAALAREQGQWTLYAEQPLLLQLPCDASSRTVALEASNSRGER